MDIEEVKMERNYNMSGAGGNQNQKKRGGQMPTIDNLARFRKRLKELFPFPHQDPSSPKQEEFMHIVTTAWF